MAGFKAITFDVEHGNCHLLRTPNDKAILIDAGSKADFSPARYLKEKWQIAGLSWLTITHDDSDHLTDISTIDEHVSPSTLEQPNLTDEQLLHIYGGELSAPLQVFLEFRRRYRIPVPPMSDPSYDWGGVQFATFNNELEDFENPNMNNLSIVTFVKYQGWGFIFPGDLEEQGWNKLLEKEEFREWLKQTDIFVAAHHGRDAGFCSEVFDYCSPILVIISDKSSSETSVTDKYINSTSGPGLFVRSSSNPRQRRKVLTTRADGAIYINIDEEGKYTITTSTTS